MKIGDLVHITFRDHCFTIGGATPAIKCEVTGFLAHINKLELVVASWVVEGDLEESNNDTYTILRSAIIKTTRLRFSR